MENKIISFGLWGTDSTYLQGAIENVNLQKVHYPGWICRFYTALDVPLQIINDLKNKGAEVVYTKKPGNYPKRRYWRIEVAFDKTVDRFIIRDCDSRLNAREAAAVKEWIESGKSVHIMRDHKKHTAFIMGGMWGALHSFFPGLEAEYDCWTKKVLNGWTPKPRIGKVDGDQAFLNQVIWPYIKDNCLVHDDRKSKTGTEIPFSVKLKRGDFVGKQFIL